MSETSGVSLDTGRTDIPDTPTGRRDSDLIRAAFGILESGIWVARDGLTTRGTRPAWLDWPSHTAAEMAPSAWPSTRIVKPAAPQRIRKPRARR